MNENINTKNDAFIDGGGIGSVEAAPHEKCDASLGVPFFLTGYSFIEEANVFKECFLIFFGKSCFV